uniref:Uncharacterized protein n=1 Tax=Rhodosorus marinus TaxID=101924 RepID=A0A7S3EGE8_9RHOD|mmetsp:Transcript_33943/g.133171  ORF Transcript_33943/g.133171 Transcript_33943/m.133171 type:complete len:292 (+) Transcript_33943:609-1484(+)|eukprot:CAMPEP_0113961170 /NCGR_PEP_ID=MMETSP0011_2-20120614/5147_1 /TAXON_ID=101924 /ORGANISM="Rhodosorus marinus" /LENGTH=291 /DNA_ID=CAMNT_0000972755 /DNA_START=593 /DNA_END=1468 /DNA_ORIENTATION=+ /assembly_acc=CAM_ASM_000156
MTTFINSFRLSGGKRTQRSARDGGRCRAKLEYDWNRLSKKLGQAELEEIAEHRELGRLVLPLVTPNNSRVLVPTDTVNVLVDGEVCDMVMQSEHKSLGALRMDSKDGVVIKVQEENWGFTDKPQLRCVASQRLVVLQRLFESPVPIAVVQLVEDLRTEGINEELELLMAVREVNRIIDDIEKIDLFLEGHLNVLSDVSSSLDMVRGFTRQVLAYRDVAKKSGDDMLSKEEILSFALLRALALQPDDKVMQLRNLSSMQRLHFAEVELSRGLRALKEFVVENYEDRPPDLLD